MVSVIIPTYNRANTIRKAAESVLEQTYKDIELIIVDDGSTDNTDEVLKEIQKNDKRVIVCKHDHNRGACAARNTGILNSKGDYIAFQDSDDIWMKEKIEKQMEVMERENVDVCFCQAEVIKYGRKELVPVIFEPGVQEKIETVFTISTQTLLFKRDIFFNNMFDERIPRLQDFDLMVRVARKNKLFFLDVPLVKVILSVDSITNQNEKLLSACEILYEKYPNLKKEYPKSCVQIARVLIKSSFNESSKMRNRIIKLALIYDNTVKTILSIPYYCLRQWLVRTYLVIYYGYFKNKI
jgi:glycosyltransferase involved in cell wall biosynthesis